MKKTRILISIIFISILLSGCSLDSSQKKQAPKEIKVGITMYDEFDPFTNEIAANISSTLMDLQTEELTIITNTVSSSKNQLVQNEQVEDFISKGYDVICVNLVDRTDPSVIIDKAVDANIPVIFFNRELVEDDLKRGDNLYYVGAKPEQSGEFQGQIVVNALSDSERFDKIDVNHDGTIQYVILEGEAGHQDAMVRTRVSVDTIKKAGFEMEKLADEIANWDRKQAQTKMTSILNVYEWQVELVLANDDNMALGAIDAIETKNTITKPLIVGVNGSDEAIEAILNGKMEGTVLNNGVEKGRIIGEMAYGLATEGKIPNDIILDRKYYYVPYELIDSFNVEDYIK